MKILLEQPPKKNVNQQSGLTVSKDRKKRENTKQYQSLIDKIKKDKKDSVVKLDDDKGKLEKLGDWVKDTFWDTPNEWIREFFALGLSFDYDFQKWSLKDETDLREDFSIAAQAIPFIATTGFDATINIVSASWNFLGEKNRELDEKIDQLDTFLKKKAAGNSVAEWLTGKGYAKNTNRMVLLQGLDGKLDQIIGLMNDMIEARNATRIFDPELRLIHYDKDGKLTEAGQEASDDYEDYCLTKKTGLDKKTREYNNRKFLNKLRRDENKVFDNFDEEIKEEMQQEMINKAKKLLATQFKNDPKLFNRLKKYENTTASDIIENPSKISEIITTTQDAIQKLQENVDSKKIEVESDQATQLTKLYKQLDEFKTVLVPRINDKFKGIDEKTKKNLINYFQNYGIFNLNPQNSENNLRDMYNEFSRLTKQNTDEILSRPFSSSNNPTLKINLTKKKILQLSIYLKILDNSLYQINHFTDLFLTSSIMNKNDTDPMSGNFVGNNRDSMTTNNLLNVIMGLMKNELNNKLSDKNSGKLNIDNMDELLEPVTRLQTFKNISIDTSSPNTADAFYAPKMLNANDKIVGMFSQKSIVENILNNYQNIMKKWIEKISKWDHITKRSREDFIEQFTKKFNKIPIITSLILLSNHDIEKNSNPIEKRYYYLYQLDISKIYDVFLKNDDFFENFLNIRLSDDVSKSNLDKTVGEFYILEPNEIVDEKERQMTFSKDMILSVFDIRKYIKTDDEMVQYIEPLELDELNNEDNKNNKNNKNNVMENLNFSYETFSFENKKISDKKNSKNLSDLFVQAGLSDLVTNKNIFN